MYVSQDRGYLWGDGKGGARGDSGDFWEVVTLCFLIVEFTFW